MSKEYIRLVAAQCHNCMKCVRECPTNALSYIHNKPVIDTNECVLCGRCYVVCPQDAKSISSRLKEILRWIDQKQKVILTVAPSFASVWPNLNALKSILLDRGFYAIDETAVGAREVSRAFMNLINEGTMENIISTCCPAIDALIEKEYPDLVPYMAPVVSPLIARGRMLKKEHPDAKVVFLSPCIAKFKEVEEARFAGAVDACIGIEELIGHIKADLKSTEEERWEEFEGSIARIYPTAGGVIDTLSPSDNYTYYAIDGITRIRSALESIRSGELKRAFLEVNACRGACMGGPLLSHFTHNEWVGQARIRRNINLDDKITGGECPVDMRADWKAENLPRPVHTEEEIRQTLAAMGKKSAMKIHNCGACGYDTCRLKAIAVLDGKADPKICLPEAMEKAQSLSNVIISNSPNSIIVLDMDLLVREMNPHARSEFGFDMVNPTGLPIQGILPDPGLEEVLTHLGRKTEYVTAWYDNYDKLFQHAIVKIPDQDLIVMILMDRTEEVKSRKKLDELNRHTMEVTQRVIDSQMRAAQEIASLLGETTAQSKIALLKLQSTMSGGNHA